MIKTADAIKTEINTSSNELLVERIINEQIAQRVDADRRILINELIVYSGKMVKESQINTQTWRNNNKAVEILNKARGK